MTVNERRKLPSWIDGFVESTSHLPSPALFRKWAAISAVAGVLEQRVWVHIYGAAPLFPNLYVLLVGAPGIGKSILTNEVETFWRINPEHHLAPNSVTKASLVDAVNAAKRKFVRPKSVPAVIEYHTLLLLSSELSDMIPSWDPGFMSTLQSFYDVLSQFREKRRGKDLDFTIPRPQLNLLGATTPSYLNSLIPPAAYDQGFLARTFLIYSGENTIKPLFSMPPGRTELHKSLVDDFRLLGSDENYGLYTWEADAAGALAHFHNTEGAPRPMHPKLINYSTRRTTHLAKLCLIAAVDRASSNHRIELVDYQRALDWLLEAETYMVDIFKQMGSGGDSVAMEECFYFVYTLYQKDQKLIAHHRVVQFLAQKIPAHSVMRVIEIMLHMNYLIVAGHGPSGQNLYRPGIKT